MKKFLRTKLALSLALTLSTGMLLSASTGRVQAQETTSSDVALMEEEAALLVTSLARAAWRTTSVRNLAYSVAAGVVAGVVEVVSGFEMSAQTASYPRNALD